MWNDSGSKHESPLTRNCCQRVALLRARFRSHPPPRPQLQQGGQFYRVISGDIKNAVSCCTCPTVILYGSEILTFQSYDTLKSTFQRIRMYESQSLLTCQRRRRGGVFRRKPIDLGNVPQSIEGQLL
ncbi:hypothetical protein J6590_051262 [Homalodisca vitripennis]|nr:hypothetical protein J6590_051262 [Homalodisca vitripennis]